MRHDQVRQRPPPLLIRKRFQFAGALLIGALLPWSLAARSAGRRCSSRRASTRFIGNIVAVMIAFWTRLSIETYPGIRRSSVILPAALTGHGVVVGWFLLTRFPYDRVGLAAGFLLHVAWLYLLYIYAERRVRRRIAIVPFGATESWSRSRASTGMSSSARSCATHASCNAIVADFTADLPDEWEAFLADAALAGPHRLSGQAAVGVADRPGRARAFIGEQLRLAASGARLFPFEGARGFRLCAAAAAAVGPRDGRHRALRSGSTAGAPSCFARSESAMPGSRLPSTSSGPCVRVETADERSAAMTKSDDRPHHRVSAACCASCASTSCRRSSTS